MITRLRDRRDEGGFTLVELIVYSVLMIIVLGLAGSLFIKMLQEQSDIKAMAETSNEAQLVYKQLEFELRNADWVQIDNGGQLMVMRTRIAQSSTVSSPYCVGYFYDSDSGELRRIQTADDAPTHNALAASSVPDVRSVASTWSIAISDVDAVGSTPMFGPSDLLFEDPEAVTVTMQANVSDDRKPIEFTKSISLRPQTGLGSGCN